MQRQWVPLLLVIWSGNFICLWSDTWTLILPHSLKNDSVTVFQMRRFSSSYCHKSQGLSASSSEAATGSKFICCHRLRASASELPQLSLIKARPHVHMDRGWSQRRRRLSLWNVFKHATKPAGSSGSTQNAVEFPVSSSSFPGRHLSTQMTTILNLSRQVFLMDTIFHDIIKYVHNLCWGEGSF